MTSGEVSPTLEEFRELAKERRVVPVVRRLMADAETPVGLYRKLSGGRSGSFPIWNRPSTAACGPGTRSLAPDHMPCLPSATGRRVGRWRAPTGYRGRGIRLSVLAKTLEVLRTPALPGLPPLTGGLGRVHRVRRSA